MPGEDRRPFPGIMLMLSPARLASPGRAVPASLGYGTYAVVPVEEMNAGHLPVSAPQRQNMWLQAAL